jgi:hypothetical protein
MKTPSVFLPNKLSKLALALFAIATACTASQAAALFTYDFNGTSTNAETGTQYAPSSVVAGLTASNVTDSSGNLTLTIGSGTAVGYVNNFLLVNPNGVTSLNSTFYFGFTVTPDSGMTLNLDSLTLDAARAGGSTRGFQIRSSADGFVGNLVISPSSAILSSQRPTYTSYTVDLSGAAFDSVAATSLEFRVYPFGGTNLFIDYDNITLNGAVSSSAIPEPSTVALLAGFSILVISAARRRRIA